MSKKWLVLFITTTNLSLIFLNSAAVPLALPTIEKAFSFTTFSIVWVVNAFLLSLISFLLIGGKLTDILGKKTLFILGFSLFGIGSLLTAVSFHKWWLIAARVIQGVGAGLSMPPTGALILAHFDLKERGKAIGLNTAISSLFLILGAPIGGFLTSYLSWRYIFWINVPICLIGIVSTALILEKEKRSQEKLDGKEAILLIGSLIFLVVGLMEGTKWGWGSPLIFSFFTLFLIFLLFFIFLLKKKSSTIIPFYLFKDSSFRLGALAVSITQLLVMVTIIISIYFQDVLKYTPSEVGLIILFATSPVILFAPLAGYLADRYHPKWPMAFGFFSLIFAFCWLVFFSSQEKIAVFLPALFAFGMGISSIFSPGFTLAMRKVSEKNLGTATSLIMTCRQLASTVGLAAMTAIFHSVFDLTQSSSSAFVSVLLFSLFFTFIGFIIALKQSVIKESAG